MKNLITILCLLCFTECAFAEVYQVPGSYKEVVEEVTVTDGTAVSGDGQVKTEKKFKLFKRRRKDYNPANTYWNFGRPPFWTGSI
ncbi:hypothetical protein J6P92_08085 [bacterium]|nr:hypothetical protein [bacterium]